GGRAKATTRARLKGWSATRGATSWCRSLMQPASLSSTRACWSAAGADWATCRSSKLNPHKFIGGFERLAIACVHGEADKRSGPGRPKRTPNPHCAAVGSDRAAPSNCGAGASASERREPERAEEEPNLRRTYSLQHGCFYSVPNRAPNSG